MNATELRKLRKMTKMSQEKFAALVGLSASTISRTEQGGGDLNSNNAERVRTQVRIYLTKRAKGLADDLEQQLLDIPDVENDPDSAPEVTGVKDEALYQVQALIDAIELLQDANMIPIEQAKKLAQQVAESAGMLESGEQIQPATPPPPTLESKRKPAPKLKQPAARKREDLHRK